MNKDKLLDSLGRIDEDMIQGVEALRRKRKRSGLMRWSAVAACLCLVIGVVGLIQHLNDNSIDPQLGNIVLSEKTTAKVTYGCEEWNAITNTKLVYFSEEEMFALENMYVFRGKISSLTNVTIDFNGEKEARCIATIVIDAVYKGDLESGEQIRMLIPCPIDEFNLWIEDTGIIGQLESGMEGIFMPWVYDENSYMEMNGDVLMLQDLASCGLADGMRWVFLNTEKGLLFAESAYPGAGDSINLDDIEAYVTEMLK